MSVTRDLKVNQKDSRTSDTTDFKCKVTCCNSCTYCERAATQEWHKSGCCKLLLEIKISLYQSIVFCQTCSQCPSCCSRSTCRGKIALVLGNFRSSGYQSKGCKNDQTSQNWQVKVTDRHKQLCQSPQEPLPVGGMTSAYEQKCSGAGQKSEISGFFQPTIFGPKAKQPVETHLRPPQSEQIPQVRKIQTGDTGNNKDLPPDRGVGNIHRFQERILLHTHSKPIQQVPAFSRPGSNLPVQSTTIWSGHSTHGVFGCGKGG